MVLLSGGDDEGSDYGVERRLRDGRGARPQEGRPRGSEGKARPAAAKVVFETNCGSFTVTLDAERAPKTAASFQYLAEQGVYDDTPFHRIVPGFVVQGGDPAGDGTGGPGYTITERPPAIPLLHPRPRGDGEEPGPSRPGPRAASSSSSPHRRTPNLPPDYALVGEVTDGFDTVLAIEALADPSAAPDPATPRRRRSSRSRRW